MGVTTALPWGEMVASALSAGGLTQFFNWLNQRSKTKAYTMGAVDHAVQTAMKLVTDRLERVEGQHEDCETKLSDVNARLDASERDRRDLASEITRLMNGPVAAVGQAPPKDVP